MKTKKRLLACSLAVMLIVAMAIPVSATTVALGRQWGNFTYGTSDTCTLTRFNCVIESGSQEYTLRTDVYYRKITLNGTIIEDDKLPGSPGILIASHAREIGHNIDYIICYHMLDGTCASTQRVEP